jgi:hypothetical protein
MAKSRRDEGGLSRTFEGAEVLDGLLELAGTPLTTADVVQAMKEGHASGEPSSEVIPTLFESEPRFSDPTYARKLFGNLLGLWDLVESGEEIDLEVKGPRTPRIKKAKPPAPTPFADEPDDGFVETAWRYLDEDEKARERAFHAFENRQDALVQWLDEQGLSDEGYGVVRHLLFELHAMLELGWPPGLASVRSAELEGPPGEVPGSLTEYVDEALFEAEQDEEAPLPASETGRARELVMRGLSSLWRARKPR